MISPTILIALAIAVAGAVSGGAAMSGVLAIKHKIALNRAVKDAASLEKDRGIIACNARVATIGNTINEAVQKARREAIEEARKVSPTPDAPEAIKTLCKASASCRSRAVMP